MPSRSVGSPSREGSLCGGREVADVDSTAAARRLSQGDTVKLAAPVGEQLTLPENGRVPDLLMVAGGTGLAPLRAVLEQIDRGWEATGSAPQVHLFHG